MVERRAATALGLAGWTSIAHAHGEGAVIFALGIASAILIVPFAIFLFFWRSSFKSKVILCGAYLVSLPPAFYAAFAVADVLSSDSAFFVVLFGLPLCVWLSGVSLLRTRATQQGAPEDGPSAASQRPGRR